MDIVLASASPRRRELLEMLGVKELRVIPAVGEEVITDGMLPSAAVCSLSLAKAEEVSKLCKKDDVVIGADTAEDMHILRRLYSQFVNHVRIRYLETTPETAEAGSRPKPSSVRSAAPERFSGCSTSMTNSS